MMDNRTPFVKLLNPNLIKEHFSEYKLKKAETDSSKRWLVEEYECNEKVYKLTCELSGDGKRNGKGIMKECRLISDRNKNGEENMKYYLEKAVVTFKDDKISGNLIIIDEITDNQMVEYTPNGDLVYKGGYLHLYEEFRYDDKGILYYNNKYVKGEWENGNIIYGVIYNRDANAVGGINDKNANAGEGINDKNANAVGWINDKEMAIYEENMGYRGEYEFEEGEYRPHGKGCLYNNKRTVVFTGKWEHGKIKEGVVYGQKKNINGRIEGETMIEDNGEEGIEYKGGYEFAEGVVRRHGKGTLYQKVPSSCVRYIQVTEEGILFENEKKDCQEVEVTFHGQWEHGKIKEGVLQDNNRTRIGNYANTSFQKINWLSQGFERTSLALKRVFQTSDHSQMEGKRRRVDENRLSGDDQVRVTEKIVVCTELAIICNSDIKEFTISDHYMNKYQIIAKLDLSKLKCLEKIKMGNNCFTYVREFVLDGLENLESVEIGEKCFSIPGNERNDGVCRITNCLNLTTLVIGHNCFEDFGKFELSNVKSLQSIQFGKWNFLHAEECILRGKWE